MNRKITIILALLILAAVSVSFAAEVNDTSDSISTADANSTQEDTLSQTEDDKVSDTSDGDMVVETSVKVQWDDNSDSAGKRPGFITVYLEEDGNVLETYNITSEDGWEKILTDLNFPSNGNVKFKVKDVPGYTVNVTGDYKSGFTIKNTLNDKPAQDTNTTNSTPKDVKKEEPAKKTTKKVTKKTTTTTTTEKVPVKKQAKNDTNKTKKNKDKNNTGNPILLGVLAVSAAGLVYALRRKE